MSSLWEGLPCAVVEARFLKLPVLAYRVGGMTDIITSGKNGFLYESGNIEQLAHGMVSLLIDKSLYKKLKECNEDLTPFTLSFMLQSHEALYRRFQ